MQKCTKSSSHSLTAAAVPATASAAAEVAPAAAPAAPAAEVAPAAPTAAPAAKVAPAAAAATAGGAAARVEVNLEPAARHLLAVHLSRLVLQTRGQAAGAAALSLGAVHGKEAEGTDGWDRKANEGGVG